LSDGSEKEVGEKEKENVHTDPCWVKGGEESWQVQRAVKGPVDENAWEESKVSEDRLDRGPEAGGGAITVRWNGAMGTKK